jgi:hypothetical protein
MPHQPECRRLKPALNQLSCRTQDCAALVLGKSVAAPTALGSLPGQGSGNQQSAISNQQSAISNQQSAISNQQSAISFGSLTSCKDSRIACSDPSS